MGFLVLGNMSVPVVDRSLSGTGTAAAVAPAADLAQPNGVFDSPGTAGSARSVLDPGAPNINSSNALAAVDSLLLGFTPTHSLISPAPESAPAPDTQSRKLDTIFGVGAASEGRKPSVNVVA